MVEKSKVFSNYVAPQVEIICICDVLTLSNDPARDDGYSNGGFDWGEN